MLAGIELFVLICKIEESIPQTCSHSLPPIQISCQNIINTKNKNKNLRKHMHVIVPSIQVLSIYLNVTSLFASRIVEHNINRYNLNSVVEHIFILLMYFYVVFNMYLIVYFFISLCR